MQDKEIVQEHFAALLDGLKTTMKQLIEDQRGGLRESAIRNAEVGRSLISLPSLSLSFLQKKNVKAKRWKAISESRLGSEIHKLLPATIARAYHPVHVKAAMRVEEATQWKGATLPNLWKRRGSTSDIANRVAFTDGKQFGSNIRSNLIGPLSSIAGDTQFGAGLGAASCDMAHLHVSEALAFGMTRNLSTAVVFLYIVAAFASMKRHLAIPMDEAANETWRLHLIECGFQNDEADAIIGLACAIRWQDAGADPNTIVLLTEAHIGTLFPVEKLTVVTKFMGGATAGKPLADLVFSAAVARVLAVLRLELLDKGVLYCEEAPGHEEFWGSSSSNRSPELFPMVADMDDVAVPILTDEAGNLVALLTVTFKLLRRCCCAPSSGLTRRLANPKP